MLVKFPHRVLFEALQVHRLGLLVRYLHLELQQGPRRLSCLDDEGGAVSGFEIIEHRQHSLAGIFFRRQVQQKDLFGEVGPSHPLQLQVVDKCCWLVEGIVPERPDHRVIRTIQNFTHMY